MDLWILKPGHKIKMRDGAEAVVLSETADGAWIRVRYLAGGDEAVPAAEEDLVHEDEVRALLGVATTGTWDDTVTVMIHHRPETSDFPGGYEATTMTGVPHNVIVNGENEDSADEALDHLLQGLRSFGFRGRVIVDDATESGPTKRYEVEADR